MWGMMERNETWGFHRGHGGDVGSLDRLRANEAWPGSGRMARNLLALCGLAGGLLTGDWLVCGQEPTGTGGDRLSIRDHVAAALESGANDEAKSALVKALATKWLGEGKDADIQAMLESIRATENKELAARIFRDFLADTALAIPAACALPEERNPFFKAVEAGRANAVRDWLGASLRKAGAPTVRQVSALTKPPEWLREGFLKWLMHDKMLGADHPRTGGQLAARLLLLLDERERPGSRTIQAGFVEWQMEDPAARGEVGGMAAYLAGVTEVCPAFPTASGWNDAVVRPMSVAWRKRLLEVAGKAKDGAGADWRKTIDDCFITLLKGMPKDERTLAATGLDGGLEFLLEPAKTTGWAELSSVKFTGFPATRAERSKTLMDLFQPYPEFQLSIERRQADNLPPDASASPEEPPTHLVAALEDSSIPPGQRFDMVDRLSRTPKPKYQEAAAAGLVLAMRGALRAGADLNDPLVCNQMNKFHSRDPHPAWLKAAADTAAMTAAAFETGQRREPRFDNAIMTRIIVCAVIGQSRSLTSGLIESHGTGLHGNMELIAALGEAGWLDLAGALCNGLPETLLLGGFYRIAKPPDWLPGLLEKIVAKSDRYRIEVAVSSLPLKETAPTNGSATNREGLRVHLPGDREATVPRLEETVMARLMPLAERFGETDSLPAASRLQCLAILSREPTVAYRLKDELERVAAETNLNDIVESRIRPDGLDRNDLWRMETAHLGNLLRDGRCGEIEKRLQPMLAGPLTNERNWLLDICTRVFYEHVLWLLADGRADRAAAAIPLSLRLYSTVSDYQYRERTTLLVELCHAAGKRYADFETWLAGQPEWVRKDYKSRRVGPWYVPNAFYQLGLYSDLRDGWDGEACEDLRIAGILTLAGDPALVKAQSRGRPLAEIVSLNIKRWATDTPADRLAVIARWREHHPNHPLLDETERLLRENAARAGAR